MSNYKLSGSAYPTLRENYDLTHSQIHVVEKAIDTNYKNGGGFGTVCLPEAKNPNQPKSNFESDIPNYVCRPAFISPSLVSRIGDNPQESLHNAKTYEGQEYYLLTDMGATEPDKIAAFNNFNDKLGLNPTV